MNRATLLGRLGKDPEIRTTQSGDKVASFSLVTSKKYKEKATGEQKEISDWHNIVVWGVLANTCEKFLRKGARVLLSGEIKTRSWEKDGNKVYTTEIVLSGFDASLEIIDWPNEQSDHDKAKSNGYQPQGGLDDDIPF